ncbi:hypothetical protein Micbo1qcDRAFT_232983 [Microdochium bolleyi]|uniref:DUF676 domain-containing protein n=1 Tax=Microdochium bolleyi TaxID=196109 RepID=A0A136J8H1_9PEZI|nr:hypothetical protein Micbo1qcDRAFT_232983 [Microdochium bolleyi]
MLYHHRESYDGFTFQHAADDLLQQLSQTRAGLDQSRPVFFICHSLGGLVAKLALIKASQREEYRWLIYACHGITFFATPHRGSSYLSMPNLRESIMHLLFLRKPLPSSITEELRLGSKSLLKVHERFLDIASELRIWTFCETVDSQLSGLGTSDHDEVHFSAPIASIKSSLTGIRAESVFSLESDHAHSASFGPGNVRIMHTYLHSLGEAVRKAQMLSASFDHTPLRLDEKVKLELIGFYEDPDTPSVSGDTNVSLPLLELRDQARPPAGQPHARTAGSLHHNLSASRTAEVQEMTAGFSRPDPAKRRFMWIHLPFNNPHWVKLIFDKLAETRHENYARLLNNEHWTKKHVKNRHANQHMGYVKPGCAFAPSESHASLAQPTFNTTNASNSSSGTSSPSHLYVYMPYLNFDSYLNIIRRRNIVTRRMAHGRARPVPPDIAQLESLEARVIWDYIGHDPPLNPRRTLDQYGYPELQDTYARDDDQMLYKLTKERARLPFTKRDMYNTGAQRLTPISSSDRPENTSRTPTQLSMPASTARTDAGLSPRSGKEEFDAAQALEVEANVLDGNVLMVDQLWLWAVDTSTLATFFPKRESHPTEGQMFQQADLRNSIYNELNGDLTGRCDNALELAAFVVLHAVTVLLNRTSHPDLEVFRIFEEALAILNERMTSSLKRFRMATFKSRTGDDSTSSDSDSDGTDDRPESIKKRHRREMEHAERENRENTSALLELRDMNDELQTMQNLFDEQAKVVETMKSIFERQDLVNLTAHGRAYLDEAREQLDEYKRVTRDLIARIEATRKDYDKFQEMVQRKAQLDEVRWSRLQTELASSQNLSVMIFTTFTVIFLPLSFFTSLFGMNTSDWAQDEDLVSLKTIGAISLPSSFLLILLSLILAFSTRVQSWFKIIFHTVNRAVRFVLSSLAKVEPRQRKQARHDVKRDTARLRRVQRRQRQRERGYDFWETVWENRRLGRYDIPDSNLKSSAVAEEKNKMRGRVDTWASIASDLRNERWTG